MPEATRLARLVDFYDKCLIDESLRDLTFEPWKASELFVGAAVDVAALIRSGDADVANARDVLGWMTNKRIGSGGSRIYLGYPIITSGPQPTIAPLLYMAIESERGSDWVSISTSETPQVNNRLLEDAGYSIDEAVEIAGRLEAAFAEATELLAEVRLTEMIGAVAEAIGLPAAGGMEHLSDAMPNTGWRTAGFRQQAILFSSDRIGFTQSTRRELASLAEDAAQWVTSTLGGFLGGAFPQLQEDDRELLLVSALSEAQRRAVASALRNPLTVVTGPPGTGKSELVLNLVASGLARGETVLVASRNNKAVDVVAERFHGLTDEAALLRAGKNTYRQQAIALIRRVVGGVRPPTASQLDRAKSALRSARLERTGLVQSAMRRLAAERSCDEAERDWEVVTSGFPESDITLAEILGSGPAAAIQAPLQATLEYARARAAGQRTWSERLIGLFQKDRAVLATRRVVVVTAAQARGLLSLSRIRVASEAELVPMLERAVAIDLAQKAWRKLNEAMALLTALPGTEDLGNSLREIADREATAGRTWLALDRQRLLADIPSDDERRLREYLRAVDQLGGTERVGARMYRDLKQLESDLFVDVQRVFPVWALTTLTARSNLPLRAGLFDLLIIDEASQCDLPSALPLIARARRVVVIGDDKQLVHVTPLNAEREQALAAEAGLQPGELVNYSYRSVSLFALARHLVEDRDAVILLDEHYRSHPDIIGFSNDRFYGGRLNIYTEPSRMRAAAGSGPAITWEDAPGTTVRPATGSAYNDAEVVRACDVVERLIDAGDPQMSIGVVTPFRVQKERITRELAKRIPAEHLERHHVIADTAHGFQGDERDVVVMSTVISAGALPGTVAFADGNPNLFNVAVTRARTRLIVVGDHGTCSARDGLLGDLARYVIALAVATPEQKGGLPDIEEEELLATALRDLGQRVVPQMEIRGFRVDIALPERSPQLAIEVDGSSHDTRDGSRLLRDVYRDVKLRRAGWDVVRVPAWTVRLNANATARRILAAVGPARDATGDDER